MDWQLFFLRIDRVKFYIYIYYIIGRNYWRDERKDSGKDDRKLIRGEPFIFPRTCNRPLFLIHRGSLLSNIGRFRRPPARCADKIFISRLAGVGSGVKGRIPCLDTRRGATTWPLARLLPHNPGPTFCVTEPPPPSMRPVLSVNAPINWPTFPSPLHPLESARGNAKNRDFSFSRADD